MIGRIYHVGLTVSDLDRSIAFYRDILGLEFQGEIFMEGKETDKMFRRANCKARVAYLNGSKAVEAPPVELIQFVDNEVNQMQSDLSFLVIFLCPAVNYNCIFRSMRCIDCFIYSQTFLKNTHSSVPFFFCYAFACI